MNQHLRLLVGPRVALVPLLLVLAAACSDDSASGAGGAGAAGGGGAGGTGGAPPECELEPTAEDLAAAPPISTPRWAFRPWISKDISTGEDSRQFVEGFLERDIPVGVLVLDSPWETNYNTYEPNPDRYPDFAEMVADFRDVGVRTVVWTTQMINVSSFDFETSGDVYEGASPDYEPALACGYFVNDDTSAWWKGTGQGIDFFDENARIYWHRMLDRVLDLGVSGFKLDFGENYLEPLPLTTDAGETTLQEYSEKYYEDFYAYGSAKLGPEEFVTMVRPYDKSYQFEGRFFARPEHAPVAWVGDNRRDYVGLQDALDHMFRSADAGYVVIGSDIGGYLDRDDVDITELVPLDADNFMRWVALGAMNPFMQLHGRDNLQPWTFPEKAEEVTAAYHFWANLHDQLVPFFDSVATQAYAGSEVRMMAPIGELAEWPDDYRYVLGGAFFVAPVVNDAGVRDITFPDDDVRYYPAFDAEAAPIDPGTTLLDVDVSDPSRIPVFIREGAIIPMEIRSDATPFGTSASDGALTLVVYPGSVATTFTVIAEDDTDEVTVTAQRGAMADSVTLSAHPRPVIVRLRTEAAPTEVLASGVPVTLHATQAAFDAADEGYRVDGSLVWIKLPAATAATALSIQ